MTNLAYLAIMGSVYTFIKEMSWVCAFCHILVVLTQYDYMCSIYNKKDTLTIKINNNNLPFLVTKFPYLNLYVEILCTSFENSMIFLTLRIRCFVRYATLVFQ